MMKKKQNRYFFYKTGLFLCLIGLLLSTYFWYGFNQKLKKDFLKQQQLHRQNLEIRYKFELLELSRYISIFEEDPHRFVQVARKELKNILGESPELTENFRFLGWQTPSRVRVILEVQIEREQVNVFVEKKDEYQPPYTRVLYETPIGNYYLLYELVDEPYRMPLKMIQLIILNILFIGLCIRLNHYHSKRNNGTFERSEVLLGALSHELKNPLNVINLNLELLEETLEDGDYPQKPYTTKYISALFKQFDFLHELIEKFLQYVRGTKIVEVEINILEFVQSILDTWQKLMMRQDIDIKLEVRGKNTLMNSDRPALQQIIVNLIKNSMEALAEKEGDREILVSLEFLAKYVKITVHDNGPGITRQMQQKLGEPFLTTKDTGLGLGLPITITLVKNLGGSINIQSEEGKGTDVSLRFPYEL